MLKDRMRMRILIFALIVLFAGGELAAQNSANIILENDSMTVEINKTTGAIEGVYNKMAKWQLIKQPKLSLGLQMIIPVSDQRNNKALSKDQKLADIRKINNGECQLTWDKINSQRAVDLPIKVVSNISLKGAAITFELSIDNNSNYRIDEVSYPCFGGVRPPEGTKTFRTKTINMVGGFQSADMLSPFPQARGYWGVDYPSFLNEYPDARCMMPFELIEMDGQGIYFGAWEKNNNNIFFLHEFAPGFLDSKHNRIPLANELSGKPAGYIFTMVRTPFLGPGEKFRFSPAVFKMYKGNWHDGVQTYTDWRKTWFEKKPQPSWIDSVDSWQNIIMLDPVGTVYYKYKDLLQVAKEAKKNGVGAIQIIGWNKGGLDRGTPFFDTDPRLGTKEEFKEVIGQIESSGMHVLLFCKFGSADATIPEFDSQIKKYTVKNFYGQRDMTGYYGYQTITGGGTAGTPLCLLSPEFRKIATGQVQKMIDLGASGIQYDQLAPGGNCYDTSHQHQFGESLAKGALLLANEFYAAAQNQNKNFVLIGEGPSDQMSQYYPLSYIRTSDYYYWVGKHVPVWKYINPEMQFATGVIGADDREMINQCLTYGYIIGIEPYNFRGKLSDVPQTMQYAKKAQELRKELKDYLWFGKFLDMKTAEVKLVSGANSDFYYSVFENKKNGKKAIVITNDESATPIQVEVNMPGKKANFYEHSMDNVKGKIYNKRVIVPARSLVVLTEQ
jgi:hypothetical protein